MAQESSGEKTEEATPKRLREARKKGQVAKSKDMDTIVQLIAAFGLVLLLRGYMGDQLRALVEMNVAIATRPDLNLELVFRAGQQTFFIYLRIVVPFLVGMAVVALASGFFQVGPIFSGEPLKLQPNRLNVVENVKRMFKVTTFVELLKNIVKITLIFFLAYMVISDSLREVVLTTQANIHISALLATKLVISFMVKVFVVFLAVAVIDLAVQRWQYRKQMRMTKDEVKREYKQDEGDPLIKSQRRQLYQEMVMNDTRGAVRSADAVVTNPTHLAIAIKYDDAEMAAPMITAKGQRQFAETIRSFAEEAGVPIIQNPPLAWTLIELDVGDEIPEDMYQAVAEILVQVYRLREQRESSR